MTARVEERRHPARRAGNPVRPVMGLLDQNLNELSNVRRLGSQKKRKVVESVTISEISEIGYGYFSAYM